MFEHHAMRRAKANPTQIHNIYIIFQSYDHDIAFDLPWCVYILYVMVAIIRGGCRAIEGGGHSTHLY